MLPGLFGEQPALKSLRAGMKPALPGALGESGLNASPSRALAHAPPCCFSRIPWGAGRCPAVRASFRLGSAAALGAGASPRLHRGVTHLPSPFRSPCLWPWQATGSAKDESRSLVSPLAAIAVKLEQRPANKAPPPLTPLPAARSSAFHSSAHRGICPFTLVICMIKAVLLPFLQPALKRQGSWSRRVGEPERSGHPAPSPPPPAEPPRAPRGAAEEGARKAPRFCFPVLFSLAALCIPFAPHKDAYSGTEMCPPGFTKREREREGKEGDRRRENRR